jgi:integrase
MTEPTSTTKQSRGRKLIRHSTDVSLYLVGGRFLLDGWDSANTRYRKKLRKGTTRAEAIRELEKRQAKKSKGDHFVAGDKMTMSTLFDALIKENERKNLTKGSQDHVKSVINANLRPRWGNYKPSYFADVDGVNELQQWFDEQAKGESDLASGTLRGFRSVLNLTFDLGRDKLRCIARNPLNEFKLTVPEKPKDAGKVLGLSEISAFVSGALTKHKEDRHLLTWRTRGLVGLFGLLTGMRNEEVAGLFFDCINLDDREIYVRRIYREDEGILETTKTGKGGYRTIPMSPILVPAIMSWKECLKSFGMSLEGPVLRTRQTKKFVTGQAIGSNHWPVLAKKAGFTDVTGAHAFTFYDLRHTFATMLRTVGVDTDDLQQVMGHVDYKTTVENYLHKSPHLFPGLKRQVEHIVRQLDLERTAEGYIDALGFVLAIGLRVPPALLTRADAYRRLEVDDQLEFELQKSLTLGGNFFG